MPMRMNPVLGSVVLIASMALFQCADARSVNAAGEDIPVWIARCNQNGYARYERLEEGAVKRAIAYLNSENFQSLLPIKRDRRSLHDHEEFDEANNFGNFSRRDAEFLENNRIRSKRFYNSMRDVNVLTIAQYDASKITDDASREKFINEKILYVIAYWRIFNVNVKNSRYRKDWSKVHMRLVGIIIALDRCSTPYFYNVGYAETREVALSRASSHWKSSSPADIPRKAYHVIATLTDFQPYGGAMDHQVSSEGGARCMIVWDDLEFRNVYASQSTVNTLHYWSRTAPEAEFPDYMKHGREVEVLPGQLFSAEQQCYFKDYTNLDRLCPEYSTNCDVWCLNKGWLKSCGSIGPAWEGTPCVNGKVG